MDDSSLHNEIIDFQVKWKSIDYTIQANPSSTSLEEFQSMITSLTNILPHRQKILGLNKGKATDDGNGESIILSDLIDPKKIKGKILKLTLIGTPESDITILDNASLNSKNDGVFNDLSFDLSSNTREWRKLQEFTDSTTINFIHPPRIGKKLLVLDLDHTLVDFSSVEDITCEEMKRPYMDQFLSDVYNEYDIVIWSQTNWKWVEIKITELGMLTHSNYKLCFILDKSSMFKIATGKVKPLHLIWSKFPEYFNKQNTLAVDDLGRNFELNKSSGIIIPPFYRKNSSNNANGVNAPTGQTSLPQLGSSSSGSTVFSNIEINKSSNNNNNNPENDHELMLLSKYLLKIASHSDLSTLDHSKWNS
eukprot:gene4363-6171_t